MRAKNLLFVMCDQLRADHLAAYGHPGVATPALDALARRGTLFENAFVQSGVCGPSRMSFYTGRYVSSHGASWNRVPLSVAELTLGDYLRQAGRSLTLIGKTHVMPDHRGLARFGLDGSSELGQLLARGSFVESLRHDGHHAEPEARYAQWLRAHGYPGKDPWSEWVISVDTPHGPASGWHMRNVGYPARVAEAHSETAYTVSQAIDFVRGQAGQPWALHLSLVKPHWPYVAPAPYHARYGPEDIRPVVRGESERDDPHPVHRAYMANEEARNFARDEVIRTVRPAYMGLIAQVDDHLGRLWQVLEENDLWKDTLVIFTADHGDFLGDHWLGEKELFYDVIQRVPCIVALPGQAVAGRRESRLIEAIDIVPTVLEALGLEPERHRVEGHSLIPLLEGQTPPGWREAVFSELDYGYKGARRRVGRPPGEARGWMVRTHRWKYLHWEGLPAQLFDLENDPDELEDCLRSGRTAPPAVVAELRDRLLEWSLRLKRRTTVTLSEIEQKTDAYKSAGVFYGQW